MFRCPLGTHDDRKASFAVYEDNHFHCFGCLQHGTIIDYVMIRAHKSLSEAIDFLVEENDLPKLSERPTPEPEPVFELSMEVAERFHYDIGMVKTYLSERRRMLPFMCDSAMLGGCDYRSRRPDKFKSNHRTYVDINGGAWHFTCNWVALPYMFDGTVYSINFRRDDYSCECALKDMGARSKCNMMDFLRADIAKKEDIRPETVSVQKVYERCFGPRFYRPGAPVTAYGVGNFVRRDGTSMIYKRKPYAILTEGEFNQLSAESLNFASLALKTVKRVNLPRLLQNVRTVLVAVDPDKAGMMYAHKILEALNNDYTKVRLMEMPKGFKDMNDMLKADVLFDFLTSKPFYLQPDEILF